VLDGYEGRACIAFRACPERRPALLADTRFFEAPYAARHGWVCLHADGPLNWREVETLLLESYRLVALKRMVAALDEQAQARDTVQQQPKRNRRSALPKRGPDNRPRKGRPGKRTS
jgi:predicted DNA-binding protein (MmcQ/YjbR family)